MTETLHADVLLENNGCTDVALAIGATDGSWTSNTTDNVSWNARWSVANPADPLTAGQTHTVQVLARKSATAGNGNPSAAVELWDNGALVSTVVASTALTDPSIPSGTVLQGTFATVDVSSGANVQVRVVVTAQGGSPAGRRNVQIDAISVLAETSAAETTPVDLTDTPTAMRLGGPGLAVVRSTTLVDQPSAIRVGGSAVTVTAEAPPGPVDIADRPSGLRLGGPAGSWENVETLGVVHKADRLVIRRRHGMAPWWTPAGGL